ncbi:MAG: hypothetical protein FWD68_03155 [Alphaproteobacteria bacterium]|nr:hypothetical protein [Alphaproteobacteria bacterium]
MTGTDKTDTTPGSPPPCAPEAWLQLRAHDDSTGPAAALVHLLYHFVADSDIRAVDPQYRAVQQRQLREAIAALRQGTGS